MADPKTITKENITEFMACKLRICEMSDGSEIDVPVDPRIDIGIITGDDPDPKFVNVEVIRAGIISKINNRRYNNNIVREINALTPGVQGFLGHQDPMKEGFEFREPQCIFVGSMIDHMPDGLDRVIAKAYLFKSSHLREWIPKSIAAGNPMTVSINATGDIMRGDYSDVIDVVHISELLSIDWANPGTEGCETSQAISVVREMQDNNEGGNNMADVSPKEIIQNTTISEFKAYNPAGYDGVIQGITMTELQDKNPRLVEQIIENNKITELALTVGGKEEKVKIKELQSMITDYEEKISKLEGQIQDAKISEMKTKLVASMVPDRFREKIMPRVSGSTEDEIKKSIEGEVAYIKEMSGGTGWDNTPAGRLPDTNGDDIKAAMAEMFGHKVEDKK